MVKIDEASPIIESIPALINEVPELLWFNNLSAVEFDDANNEVTTLVKRMTMEEELDIDNSLKNSHIDNALSHHLRACVYYFWGEENKSIFDSVRSTYDIELTSDVDCIAFRFDGFNYLFVHCDSLVNNDSAHEMCMAIQKDWYLSTVDPDCTFEDVRNQPIYMSAIAFIISHLYVDYDVFMDYVE